MPPRGVGPKNKYKVMASHASTPPFMLMIVIKGLFKQVVCVV